MCGRYELASPSAAVAELLALEESEVLFGSVIDRRDIRPTDGVLIATNEPPRRLQTARWGFIARSEVAHGKPVRPINARDDKLAGKSWIAALEGQRCLIPATAFFEWRVVPGRKKKQPVKFSLRDRGPFCFAGLWSRQGNQLSCTIITTSPSTLVAPVHNRMPAILPRELLARWSAPGLLEVEEARALLAPYPAALMIAEDADPRGAAFDQVPEPAQRSLF